MASAKIKQSNAYRVFTVCNTVLMALISAVMLYPFIYLIAQSFSSAAAINAGRVGLLPVDFNVDTYKNILAGGEFVRYYGNTIVYSLLGTALALLLSSMLAYPLSKVELKGNKIIGPLIIFTMYFGGGMIPSYVVMITLGLRDTVAGFLFPGLISTYYVILMRSFFATIPKELEEAGEMDGLNKIGVFFRIALPLSMPIMATMALFYLVQYWNDWFDAFLYLDTKTKIPVALHLRNLISTAANAEDAGDSIQVAANIKSCAMVLTAAPIICVYPFIQKYFVQGMMLGGVKG